MATASATLLDEVNSAISACLTSQAYTVRGRSQQKARLAELMAARRDLIGEVNESSANNGSMVTVGQIRGAS
jgi:hypothetical protein